MPSANRLSADEMRLLRQASYGSVAQAAFNDMTGSSM